MGFVQDLTVHRAQDSWLNKFIPRDKIPEFLRLASLGKDAVLRFLTPNGEVLEIASADFGSYMSHATAYWNSLESDEADNRFSTSTFASASSAARSTFSRQSIGSLASNFTTYSQSSTFVPLYPSKFRPIPIAWQRQKKYQCPSCGHGYKTNAAELWRHLNDHCEKPVRQYKCHDCYFVSEDETSVRSHQSASRHSGHVEMPHIPKKFYGCPYSGLYLTDLRAYYNCLRHHQERDRQLVPQPSKRLRALLNQPNEITLAVSVACLQRGLRWREDQERFTWSDEDCNKFSNVLEYGCNDPDDIYRRGVDAENLEGFIECIMNAAEPLPRPAAYQQSDSTPMDEEVDSALTDDMPMTKASTPLISGSPTFQNAFSMDNSSAQLYRDSTKFGLVYAQEESMRTFTSKRQASLDSTSHAESTSRARRYAPPDRNPFSPEQLDWPFPAQPTPDDQTSNMLWTAAQSSERPISVISNSAIVDMYSYDAEEMSHTPDPPTSQRI